MGTQELKRIDSPASDALMPQIMESVLMVGDLSRLSPADRVRYYGHVCDSMKLNPLTKPFEYISLNNKLTLYATKNCTDQLRHRDSVSIKITGRDLMGGIYVVTASASTPDGRIDESTGAVSVEGLKGESLANAYMKAETKAKRRATLSICGMGILDELEVDSAPGVRHVRVDSQGQISEGTGTVAPEMRQQAKEEPRITPQPAQSVQQPSGPAPASQEADPEVQALFARMTNKIEMIKVLGEVKARCVKVLGKDAGESSYYQIIGKHGAQHANDFKSTGPAKAAVKFMVEALREIEKQNAQPATTEEPPTAADEWGESQEVTQK